MPRTSKIDAIARDMTKQADEAARFLRVLSNSHRLRVLCLLLEGELSVGEINAMVPVSQSVLSQHLAVLRTRKLVNTRRVAQTIYYSVAPGPVADVVLALHGAFCRRPGAGSRALRRAGGRASC